MSECHCSYCHHYSQMTPKEPSSMLLPRTRHVIQEKKKVGGAGEEKEKTK